MFRILTFICFLYLAGSLFAHDFVAVFFDDESAKTLHTDAPLPRGLKAQLITKLAEAGVRGLVVKFFEDLPQVPAQDRAYAKALCLLPTTLQACLCEDGSTNALPQRFFIGQTNSIRVKSTLEGSVGYIPLPEFSGCAQGVGFVDLLRKDGIPLMEIYQGKLAKSLYVTALEIETGETAKYTSNAVTFGKKRLTFNEFGEHVVKPPLPAFEYLPFQRVLDGSISAGKLRGKVVIIGYAGRRIHTIATPWGNVEAHQMFLQNLLALYQNLEEQSTN